jgi:AmmeMemoRadiSam system protein B
MKRKPAVAGQFYYSDPDRLTEMIEDLVPGKLPEKEKVKAVLSPHAGLVYSGSVAGAVYAGIEPPETFVLIGPNHMGMGAEASIMTEGRWEMPTGEFPIDEGLSKKILKSTPLVTDDPQAHMFEHSLEVQLPFLSHFAKGAKIVPITVLSATLEELKAIGKGIAEAIEEVDYSVVIVASSDMSHYVQDKEARELDRLAIDRVLELDPDGLYTVVRTKGISMCGVLPTVIMLTAARSLGATEAKLVKYTTSAEVSGDYDSVVGYAGIIIN